MTTMTGLPLAGAALGLTGLASALVPLVAIAAAAAPAVYHKEIADWIDDKAPWASDALWKATTPSEWAFSSTPPASGKPITVQTQVNLDGRKVATAVTTHQSDAANAPPSSGGGFDGRRSFVAPSDNPFGGS